MLFNVNLSFTKEAQIGERTSKVADDLVILCESYSKVNNGDAKGEGGNS